MKSSPNLCLSILVAAGILTLSTAVHAQDLSEESTDGGTVLRESGKKSPYRGVLAAADESGSSDSGSGISGADGSSTLDSEKSGSSTSEDGSPKEEDTEQKPKKKKSKSWWPFGRSRDTEAKKKKKKSADDTEITPNVDVPASDPLASDGGADSKPIEKDALAPEKPVEAAADAAASAVTPADPIAVSERTKNLQESLPADISERAKRGDSRIKDLLDKAQAIKNRQAERVKEADDAKVKEDEHAREMERESARLRAAAARGELPEDSGAVADTKGSKADKLKALSARREELIAEGAPQDKLDALDARIAALKKPSKKGAKNKDLDVEPTAKASKKSRSKAARTGKTSKSADTASDQVAASPKKKKKKAKTVEAKATEPKDDIGAPPMPTDAAPEPAPAGPATDTAASDHAVTTPKKKKKTGPVAPLGAPNLDAPAVPSAGEEFKLDSPAPASNPGL